MGLYGLYSAPIIALLLTIVISIRFDTMWSDFTGIGVVLLFTLYCIFAHFAAVKFLASIENTLKSTPSKLGSTAFLDIIALLSLAGGIGAFILGIIFAFMHSSFNHFLLSFIALVVCLYTASLCFKPSALNIEIDSECSAAEELMGLFSFFIKSMVKMTPIFFGAAIIVGNIELLSMLFTNYADKYLYYYISDGILSDVTEVATTFSAALIPITAYFLFIMYYFIIDIMSSILSIRKIAK